MNNNPEPILNLAFTDLGILNTLGEKKTVMNARGYVSMTRGMLEQGQEPMYLNAFEIETIPPEVARQLRERAAQRVTESSIQRRKQEAQLEQVQ